MNAKKYNFYELKGKNINNAIQNMIAQLLSDNNEIENEEEISLDRIIEEIETLSLKFDKNGNIVI